MKIKKKNQSSSIPQTLLNLHVTLATAVFLWVAAQNYERMSRLDHRAKLGLDTILWLSAWAAVPFLHWAWVRRSHFGSAAGKEEDWYYYYDDPAVWVREAPLSRSCRRHCCHLDANAGARFTIMYSATVS